MRLIFFLTERDNKGNPGKVSLGQSHVHLCLKLDFSMHVCLVFGEDMTDLRWNKVSTITGISLPFKAVMASDFAVPRFRYLERLLIVHGHWCYSRLANMVLYFFYKNTVGI